MSLKTLTRVCRSCVCMINCLVCVCLVKPTTKKEATPRLLHRLMLSRPAYTITFFFAVGCQI